MRKVYFLNFEAPLFPRKDRVRPREKHSTHITPLHVSSQSALLQTDFCYLSYLCWLILTREARAFHLNDDVGREIEAGPKRNTIHISYLFKCHRNQFSYRLMLTPSLQLLISTSFLHAKSLFSCCPKLLSNSPLLRFPPQSRLHSVSL